LREEGISKRAKARQGLVYPEIPIHGRHSNGSAMSISIYEAHATSPIVRLGNDKQQNHGSFPKDPGPAIVEPLISLAIV